MCNTDLGEGGCLSPRQRHTELLMLMTSVWGSLALHLKRKLNWKRESPLVSPDLASLILDFLKAGLEIGVWVSVTYGGKTRRERSQGGGVVLRSHKARMWSPLESGCSLVHREL